MSKSVKELFEVYKPKSPDEQRFVDKHVTIKHKDRNGNGDDVFKATNVKTIDRKKDNHGYNPGEDDKVYEGTSSYKDGYYVTNGGDLTHHHDSPFKDSKSAIRFADKLEDKTGQVHTVNHVKGGNVHKQWQYQSHGGGGSGWIPYSDHKTDPFHARRLSESTDDEINEGIEKVGTYSSKSGDFLSLHRNTEDKTHHMLVNKKGDVVGSYTGTTQEVHKKLSDDGLHGTVTEELDCQADKIKKLNAKTARQKKSNEDKFDRMRGKGKYDEVKEESELEEGAIKAIAADLHHMDHGNFKKKYGASKDTVQSRFTSVVKKKSTVKEDTELNEMSLNSYEKEKVHEVVGIIKKQNPDMEHKEAYSMAVKKIKKQKLTKEDVINLTINKFMPEEVKQISDEEKLVEKIIHLPESHIMTLLELFDNMDDENRQNMIEHADNEEIISELLDLAIELRNE